MVSGRTIFWAGIRPAAFEDFLRRFGADRDVELLDGTAVERMPAPAEHEGLCTWLHDLIAEHLQVTKQGCLYDGATPIEISPRRARRPDLFFVRHECRGIVRRGAVFGAPSLVIEIVSTYDLSSDLAARERDYRALGVPEIAFLDPIRRQARVIRRYENSYTEEILLLGATLRFDALTGLNLPTGLLFAEDDRPPARNAIRWLCTSAA